MLTVDVTTLKPGDQITAYVLEFDVEHGCVQVLGEGQVCYTLSGTGEKLLESAETGGCYTDPQTIGGVEVRSAEEHYIAIFPDQASMRAGARELAREWGDQLPIGIHRVLA